MDIETIFKILTDGNHDRHDEVSALVRQKSEVEKVLIDNFSNYIELLGYADSGRSILWEEYHNVETGETQGADGDYDLVDDGDIEEHANRRRMELQEIY